MTEKRNRRTRLGSAALLAAIVLTSWALAANFATFATDDYTAIVIQAVASSTAALVVLRWAWRRSSIAGRVLAIVLVIAAGIVLLDAAGRRLPAVLGR